MTSLSQFVDKTQEETSGSPALEIALAHAKAGRPVFPCDTTKRPHIKGWPDVATTEEATVRGWWAQWPDAMIGMPTGARSGVWVLDIDTKNGKDGEDALYALRQTWGGTLPGTVEALTPSGGRHLWFRYPEGRDVRSTVDKLSRGLDTRGRGGYVILPGSVTTTGGRYEWEGSSDPDEGVEIAPAPEWLLKLVTVPHRPPGAAPKWVVEEASENDRLKAASALAAIPADGYDIWIAVGQAMQASGLPYEMWDDWSQTSPNYGGADKTWTKWQSFDGAKGRGEGTLFFLAREQGWEEPLELMFPASDEAPPPPLPERLDAAQWPNPMPLPDLRPPVPPFEEDLLPEQLRPWLCDIAERMQCPPEFPAVGAMVSLASLVGRQLGIRPKRYDDWLVVPNLWGAVIGRPGVMKTPALEEPMKPLHRLKSAAMAAHETDLSAHDADTAAHEAMIAAAKKALAKEANARVVDLASYSDARGALGKQAAALREIQESAPQAPKLRRYMTSDGTHEKLGELLAENPTGLLVYRDELVSWLKGLDREGREEGRGFYLQGWNGTGSYTFDRIARGTVHIEAVCLSILGGIQPGPLSDYVYRATHNGAGNDGLLQRFQLLVWPDDSGAWRNVDRWPDTEAKNTAFAIFERLDMIDVRAIKADVSEGIPFLRFSHEAQERFDEWRAELETVKLRSGEPEPLEAHLSKYRSLAPSLALLFHLIDGDTGPVSAQAAARAFNWCGYLEGHARRVYGAATMRGIESAHALAAKIREGRLPPEFKPRDVYRNEWSRLDKDGTSLALDVLADWEWLRVRTVATGGRPSNVVHLNPKLGGAPWVSGEKKFPARPRVRH